MNKQLPDDRIIDRAVDLWCRELRAPRFDNGDRSFIGAVGMGLAQNLARTEIEKVDDWVAAVERFSVELSTRLKFLRDNDERPRPQEEYDAEKRGTTGYVSANYYFDGHLDVDYHPSRRLAEAAEKAGVPTSAFSIKSSVYVGENFVETRFGYGADLVNHYPLPDGRWLLTTLRGSDMRKVVEYVMGGQPSFEIEGVK